MKWDNLNYIQARNPIDMAEGGSIRDNSTRVAYLLTARKMIQPPMPNPVNKTTITSYEGILYGYIPFQKPSPALVMDASLYRGLLSIDDQPTESNPSTFATSGSPKGEVDKI